MKFAPAPRQRSPVACEVGAPGYPYSRKKGIALYGPESDGWAIVKARPVELVAVSSAVNE